MYFLSLHEDIPALAREPGAARPAWAIDNSEHMFFKCNWYRGGPRFKWARAVELAKREAKRFLARDDVRAKLGDARLTKHAPLFRRCEANYPPPGGDQGSYEWGVVVDAPDGEGKSTTVGKIYVEIWNWRI